MMCTRYLACVVLLYILHSIEGISSHSEIGNGKGNSLKVDQRKKYMMYTWQTSWDPTAPGCDQKAFLEFSKTSTPQCWTNTWDTAAKRDKMFSVANRPGREVEVLLLYGTKGTVWARDCSSSETVWLRQTLAQGHSTVPGLQIYGLLSDGGANVPEAKTVPHMVWYNNNCAQSNMEKLDGVAVNNEDFRKNWSEKEHVAFLTALNKIHLNAGGELKTHFSIGYHWYHNNGKGIIVDFNGKQKNVVHHMIDIFDSVDVQTAFVLGEQMVKRLLKTGWNYSQRLNKKMYNTVYLNRVYPEPCQISFFPVTPEDKACPSWSLHGERPMWQQLDKAERLLPGFLPSLHYYMGPYSSGGNKQWPKH